MAKLADFGLHKRGKTVANQPGLLVSLEGSMHRDGSLVGGSLYNPSLYDKSFYGGAFNSLASQHGASMHGQLGASMHGASFHGQLGASLHGRSQHELGIRMTEDRIDEDPLTPAPLVIAPTAPMSLKEQLLTVPDKSSSCLIQVSKHGSSGALAALMEAGYVARQGGHNNNLSNMNGGSGGGAQMEASLGSMGDVRTNGSETAGGRDLQVWDISGVRMQ